MERDSAEDDGEADGGVAGLVEDGEDEEYGGSEDEENGDGGVGRTL